MGAKILGIPNMVDPRWLTATATSEASASMAGSNLMTPEPSEFWRSASNSPYATIVHLYRPAFGAAGTFGPLDGVALVGTNTSPGALWRVVHHDGNTLSVLGTQERAPVSIEDSFNLSGAVTDIDEPLSGGLDSAVIGPAVPLSGPWQARVRLADPSTSPVGVQSFCGHFRLSGELVAAEVAPRVAAELWQGGVLIRSLGEKRVTKDGLYLYWHFDAAELTDPSGADVDVKLTATIAQVGMSQFRWTTLDALAWLFDDGLATAAPEYDSGWLTVDPAPVGETGLDDPAGGTRRNLLHLLSEPIDEGTMLWVLIRDDHSVAAAPGAAVLDLRTAAPGYVEVGAVVVGKAFAPTYSPSFGPTLSARDLSDKGFTEGGQTFGVARPVLRVVELPLQALTQAEAMLLYDRLALRRGLLGPVLVALDPANEAEREETTVYCTLDEMPSLDAINAYNGSESMRSAVFRFIEKL